MHVEPAPPADRERRPWSVFLVFLRLGLTSFGGPVAHLGYFRQELVARRRWVTEATYADLVALGQFLPGPASSQVGLALGFARAGIAGALAAGLGFTLPSAVIMISLARGIAIVGDDLAPASLQGLKIVAVAIVAQAVWGMARVLCNDAPRASIMAAAACAVLLVPEAWVQVGVIVAAGALGLAAFRPHDGPRREALPSMLGRRTGALMLSICAALLVALPALANVTEDRNVAELAAFYRVGALVFGGGHVILPLLQAVVVAPGWLSGETFLAGYGAAQALPGPLFTFAGFLGASFSDDAGGWLRGVACLLAIYAPSFLLVIGAMPFWEDWRRSLRAQAALRGVNAAVVGLLLAALYRPVWSTAIHAPVDFCLALVAFVALVFWRLPPWLVVLGSGAGGWLMYAFA